MMVALRPPASRVPILGHAMAHEIRHLLGRVHVRTGLMRGKWDEVDYRRMVRGEMCFTAQEAAEMCKHVRRRAD
jgi:hypothetical protein